MPSLASLHEADRVNFQTGLKLGQDLRKQGALADDGGGLKKAVLDLYTEMLLPGERNIAVPRCRTHRSGLVFNPAFATAMRRQIALSTQNFSSSVKGEAFASVSPPRILLTVGDSLLHFRLA